MFSPFLADFQNLMTSCETMFSVTMGRPIYSELRSLYRVCGPVFYFTFCFMAAFIILNVLISIINESYSFTVEQMNKQQNQYEIVDFMMKRFAKWTGLSVLQGDKGNPKKIAPLMPTEVPLPELPGNVQTSYNHQYVELQKTFDQYLYDLEHKYSKFLTLEELREEVMGEMAQVPMRNNRVHGGVRNRRISRMSAARLPPSIAYQDRNYLFMSSESGSSSGFPSTSSRTGPSSSSGGSTYGSSSSGTYTTTSSSSGSSSSSSGKSGRSGPSTSSRKPSSTAGPARVSKINTVSAKAGARKY